MSKMVTMRTEKPHRRGKSVNISGVSVEFDKLGFADVVERHVEDLLKGGLEIVDKEDLEKFAKQREQLKEAEENNAAPVVDLHDENAKLKLEVDGLKKENEVLKNKLAELKPTLTDENEKGEVKTSDEDLSIEDMNKAELIGLCKEIKFPEKEWNRNLDFILKKI